jgi:hypothetical protein
MKRRCLVIGITLGSGLGSLAACGDDGAKDASVDIDNGSCGDMLRFTGELMDWDSHTMFCGVKDASLEVPGGGAMDSTAPNGRFDLCLPGANKFDRLMVTFDAAASQCTQPPSTYMLPVMVYADHGVIKAGGFYSARAMTMARQMSFFTQIQQTMDPARGHVLVHVNGMKQPKITLSADHGPSQVTTTSGWAAGEMGSDIFFPNVAAGNTKLTIDGGGTGETEIPVVAGTITNVAVLPKP